MILDKFKNAKFRSKYSFNTLAIFSLIIFFTLVYEYFSIIYLTFVKHKSGLGFPLFIILVFLFSCFYIASFVALIIYIFERIYNIRIKSEKFLNSKFIFWFQILGFASFLILILLHLYFVIMLFI